MTLVHLPKIDRAVEIERLAALDTVDYEIARKEAADQLGIRASVLDDLRIQKRRELKLDNAKSDDGQGRTLALPEVMPWPDPIEGGHDQTIHPHVRCRGGRVCSLGAP